MMGSRCVDDIMQELRMSTLTFDGECDTLDTLPELATVNARTLDMIVLQPWRHMIGFIVQGGCSMQWPSVLGWGERTVSLTNGEMLQMRITPKGCVGASEVDGVITLSTRIFNLQGQAMVQTAFLWNPHSAPFPDPDLAGTRTPGRTMGCRNLHLLMPSLFHQQDPNANSNDVAMMGSEKWPITDRFNYHSVRPSTFTVVSYECPPGAAMTMKSDKTQTQFTGICSTTPGLSTYVVAGALVGANVEDRTARSAIQVKYQEWQHYTNAAIQQIEQSTGPATVTDACNCAMTLLDVLSAEGIIGMLGNMACQDALPENMHKPGGMPLIIAAMMRICAHPARYKDLTRGTNADQMAVEELNFLFESHDAPIVRDPDRFWAIDVAIRRGLNDAREAAMKVKQEISIADNLVYIQRAGLQCAKDIFGSVRWRDDPDRRRVSKWGRSSLVEDPLEDAKQRVMAKKDLMDNRQHTESMKIRMGSRGELRVTLIGMMRAVEHWLRTGTYSGMQISKKNNPDEPLDEETDDPEVVALRIHRIEESQKKLREKSQKKNGKERREMLREAYKAGGMAALAAETQAAKNGMSVEEVQRIASAYQNQVLFGDSDSSASGCEEDSDDGSISPIELQMQTKKALEKSRAKYNVDAMRHASQALSSFFCNGPLVHQQLDINCWLCSPHMENVCADCDKPVNVLPVIMLENAFSHCLKCKRRRCLKCRDGAAQYYVAARAQNKDVKRAKYCRHCNNSEQKTEKAARKGRK